MTTQMKRIGIDCRLWNETGVGRYIRNLVLELNTLHPEFEFILFVLPKDKENIKNQTSHSKCQLIEANFRWHSLQEQIQFPEILYKAHLDLMHFPYFSVPLLYGKPFILTIHDMITWKFATGKASSLFPLMYWFKQLVYRFVVGSAAHRARKIIAVSQATKKEIITYLHTPEKKIDVIYEGVSEIKHLTKTKNENTYGKYFLYVGNAYPHKNVSRLLEAFSILNEETNIKLLLVGKENYFYNKLKDFVVQNDIKHVIYTGFVSDEALAFLYKHAIATVIPSLDEGFGLPALEAITNNCLVVASDIPALKEICGESAVYFDPYSVTDIVEKLKRVIDLSQKEITEKKTIGKKRLHIFSWEKMAKETIKTYESCFSLR